MVQKEFREFAMEIVEAWNSHDLERILSHYSDDFELTSPLIKKVLEIDDGTIKGKKQVRDWWRSILARAPNLHFEFVDVAESVDCKALVQKSSHNNKNVVSVYWFNEEGKIRKEVYLN